MWALAIPDDSISNWFETKYKRNAYEYDFIRSMPETDYGKDQSHGTIVALSAYLVNPALEFINLRIVDGSAIKSDTEITALSRLMSLISERSDINIGAINLSWGGRDPSNDLVNKLKELSAKGIYAVAATGNDGGASYFENPLYPAAQTDVIAVGAHDGAGNPAAWSQNSPKFIVVLADGQDFPAQGREGTSFAAPQVAATVATVQAYASATLKRRLTLDEIKSVLQQGGNGPLSAPDPADQKTRYFLHDHAGSLRYFVDTYLNRVFDPYSYLASNQDLIGTLGIDVAKASAHFAANGALEGRTLSFDGWSYLASYADLQAMIGSGESAGQSAALHYLRLGKAERRSVTFDAESYLAANDDLLAALGRNVSKAARHYVTLGRSEGRATTFEALNYIASYGELIAAFGTDTALATQHYVDAGYAEGRRVTFDPLAYLAANPDVAATLNLNLNLDAAAREYIQSGYRDHRATSFDALGYLASNPGLLASIGADTAAAMRHYIVTGYKAGLTAKGFSAQAYLDANDDLFAAFANDMTAATRHYVTLGWREGRATSVNPAAASTLEGSGDLAAAADTTGRLYVGTGVTGTFNTRAATDHDWYRIKLYAGQTVVLTLTALPLEGRSAATPALALLDSQGRTVQTGTPNAAARNSTLTYTPSSGGYFLVDAAGSFNYSGPTGALLAQPYALSATLARSSYQPLAAGW